MTDTMHNKSEKKNGTVTDDTKINEHRLNADIECNGKMRQTMLK